VTICGDWLLNLVKQAWPAWAEHVTLVVFRRAGARVVPAGCVLVIALAD
jgi:hypothetical protein